MTHTLRDGWMLALLSLPAAGGQTWIVDDDGGPGVDFDDLPEAIDSPLVADGDVLLVMPGTYDTLEASRPLVVLGQGAEPSDVYITTFDGLGGDLVQGVDGLFVLANLEVSGPLLVEDCTGPVVLSDFLADGLKVGSSDVRIEGSRIEGDGHPSPSASMVVDDGGTLELSESTLPGSLVISDSASFARVARTAITGTPGFHSSPFNPNGGDGTAAVKVPATLSGMVPAVHLTGDGLTLTGGDGGFGEKCALDGEGGPAIFLEGKSVVRHSGYVLEGGYLPDLFCVPPGQGQAPDVAVEAGILVEPMAPDPTLQRVNQARPGATVRLHARAQGAGQAMIFGGFTPLSLEIPGVVGRLGAAPELLLKSEEVGEDGIVSASIGIPPTAALSTVFHVQALGVFPGEEPLRLTNTVPLVIR